MCPALPVPADVYANGRDWLMSAWGLTEDQALTLITVACDVQVHQVRHCQHGQHTGSTGSALHFGHDGIITSNASHFSTCHIETKHIAVHN